MDSSNPRARSSSPKRATPEPEPAPAPASAASVAAAELRWLPRRMGGWRGIALYAVFLVILGYMFPTAMGLGFLDPHILLVYACSAPFFASSPAVESFADPRLYAPPRTSLTGKALAATAFGWLSALASLALGLASVNLREWHGSPVLPDTRFLAGIAGLGLSLAALATAAAAFLAVRLALLTAKTLLRRTFVIALISVAILARYSELEWKDSFTAMLAPDSILKLSLTAMLLFLAAAAALFAAAARHPRYSGVSSTS